MICLAIESSCDETSLAILEVENLMNKKLNSNSKLKSGKDYSKNELKFTEKSERLEEFGGMENHFQKIFNQTKVISQIISSQIEVHKNYGGVIPEIGAREHAKAIHTLFEIILMEACKKKDLEKLELLKQIETIFVTAEPGLKAGLRVGIEFAKATQFFLQKINQKKVEINYQNHLRGHVASCFFKKEKKSNSIFPHLHLLVSGGNTQLILLNSWKEWKIVGKTLDDAAGECFDKIGRMVGLPYPAGVWVSKIAEMKDKNTLNLPIGMSKKPGLDFSYSGLKTAVRYFVQKQEIEDFKFEKRLNKKEIKELLEFGKLVENKSKESNNNEDLNDYDWNNKNGDGINKKINPKLEMIYNICLSSQSVITEQLKIKTKRAVKKYKPKSIGISGGVSANQLLRQKIQKIFEKEIFLPPLELTGDNAVMIGLSGICDSI